MADRLTQLQDFLDDLLTQMYASLNYVHTRAPYAEIPGQPSQAPTAESTANGETHQTPAPAANGTPQPDAPDKFKGAMHELAEDLILKEQQIEIVIKSLPGIGSSEGDQEKRMRELEGELRQMEEERAKKETEKQQMIDMLGDVIGKIKRVP